jgi:hypothetical protein
MGLISTNTIAQGDTRRGGLRCLRAENGEIYSAQRRIKWPGDAAVTVSVLHVAKGVQHIDHVLDGVSVGNITAFLLNKGADTDPPALQASSNICYNGCDIKGQGFLFYDSDPQCHPTDLMRSLIKDSPRNSERIQPYIGGEEITDLPSFQPYRWAINFGTMPLADAREWPELLSLVESKVPAERGSKTSDLGETPWWQYWRPRREMFSRIANLDRVLVCSQTAKFNKFLFFPIDCVFSNYSVVAAFDSFSAYSILESQAHGGWVATFSATLEDRQRYMPSDCFETFPFPPDWESNTALETAGREYYEYRAALMVRNDEGLTKTYNRFHDPEERSPDIHQLRTLHAAMDRAVLAAYGWEDIPTACEFLLDYEEDEDSEDAPEAPGKKKRAKKKPYRYRWPDEVRDEVLACLLALNAERAAQEELSGTTKGKATAKKSAKIQPINRPKREDEMI